MAMRQTADEQAPPVPSGVFTPEFGPQVAEGEQAGSATGAPPLDLQGSGTVDAAAIERRLPADSTEGTIPVRFGSLAEGEISVKKRPSGEYGTPANQSLQFSHPGLASLADQDVSPVLAVDITDGALRGYVSLAGGRQSKTQKGTLFRWIANNPALMGWAGLDRLKMPGFENKIEGGQLVTKVDGFSFTLGGFMDGTGSFGLVGETVVFDAEAAVDVAGLEEGTLQLQRTPDGALAGTADLGVAFDTFTGTVHAAYGNGTVAMEGTAAYQGEKFDGSVTLLVTHRKRAEDLARERLGPDAVQESAEGAAGEPAAGGETPDVGPEPGPRAVAGYGTVNVNLTEWLAGSADVIVDGKGDVTVVGEVAPPATVTLFEQKEYIHEFPRVEVRAIYGVPVVGNLNVFANIGVDAIAKLGPATLYDIVLDGTYSTDPDVYQNYSLAASLNVSAFAGIRIRAEGGVGVTIVAHDLKAGVGIESTAGIRGYVDARPTIGYREEAAPEQGKTGQFYIAGHMEIAAQPSISMGGDLFVELDSPWYSPAPDKKWTWPVGSLEYPLPGEFGLGADLDYVLGSDAVPDIEFGEVAFDSEKFMTDLMNDNVPTGSGGETETQGTFEDMGESTDQPTVESGASEGSGTVDKPPTQRTEGGGRPEPAQGRQSAGEETVPSDSIRDRWLAGIEALEQIASRSDRDPMTEQEMEAVIARLKREYRFTQLRATRRGSAWQIQAAMNPEHETQWDAVAARVAEERAVREDEQRTAEERFSEVTEEIREDTPKRYQTVATMGRETTPETAAGGASPLTRTQRERAIRARVIPIRGGAGAHAEERLFTAATPTHSVNTNHGWLESATEYAADSGPVRIYSDNEFCGRCRQMIVDAGGELVSKKMAEFSRATEPQDLAQSARIRGIVFVNNYEGLTRSEYIKDLKRLSGIGDVWAGRIATELLDNGQFSDQADLVNRVGLPASAIEDLKDRVSFKPGDIDKLRE